MLAGWIHHGLAIFELNCFNFYSIKKVAKKIEKMKDARTRCTHTRLQSTMFDVCTKESQRSKIEKTQATAEQFPVYLWHCSSRSDTQPAFTCSKLTTETLEQVVKYVQS